MSNKVKATASFLWRNTLSPIGAVKQSVGTGHGQATVAMVKDLFGRCQRVSTGKPSVSEVPLAELYAAQGRDLSWVESIHNHETLSARVSCVTGLGLLVLGALGVAPVVLGGGAGGFMLVLTMINAWRAASVARGRVRPFKRYLLEIAINPFIVWGEPLDEGVYKCLQDDASVTDNAASQ